MPLFTAKDLSDFLQYPVEDATAAIDERVVSGWLAEEGLTYTGSDTVPDQVFSWALELGAIVHENPTSSTTDQTAGQMQAWSTTRVPTILLSVRRYAERLGLAPVATEAVPAPVGRFPGARPLPDPAERPAPRYRGRAAGAEYRW